jgi:hypothetical protein
MDAVRKALISRMNRLRGPLEYHAGFRYITQS